MLTPKTRISALFAIVLAAATLAACGSPRTTADNDAPLEKAIASYIDGDLDAAEPLFLEVTSGSQADEDLQTAYLYLGRIYLARGDYVRAADALSTGKALGGDVRFDEYFEVARRHLMTSPARMIQLERITRRELAALAGKIFGDRLRESWGGAHEEGGARSESADRSGERAAEDPFDLLGRAGVMSAFPDGDLHGEEAVTWPAFYVFVSRLAEALGGARAVTNDLFPGGYRSVLTTGGSAIGSDAPSGKEQAAVFVSGREAVSTLETLDRTLGTGKTE